MSESDNFRQQLLDSGVLSSEKLESLLAEYRSLEGNANAEPSLEFVDWLVQQKQITGFQGAAIMAGHAGVLHIGGYRLLEQVAPGQLGGYFHAVHEEYDQPVTLKLFMGGPEVDAEGADAQLGSEARIIATSDHPSVIRSYQIGQSGNLHFVALEQLKGETLADRLDRDVWMPFQDACRVGVDVAKGLEHLHQNDIVHRDLRPETIWICEDGSAKLIDFEGASDAFVEFDTDEEGHALVDVDSVIGQYEFTAWEQALDPTQADSRSDIYSLGCVLYYCLAGRPPFIDKNPVKLALKHAMEKPERISTQHEAVPAPIDDTLGGMLANDPADRFQSPTDVAYAFQQYLPEEDSGERVQVVEVSDEYLDWARSQHRDSEPLVHVHADGITPEMTDFLSEMSKKRVRRGRRYL